MSCLWQTHSDMKLKIGIQRALHVDSTWILCRYVEDQISMNFHVISTYVFDIISMVEKSTLFPLTFFDVISMVEKSTLLPGAFFRCKIHCVSTYFFWRNFDGRIVYSVCTYFFRRNFDKFDVVVGNL